MATKIGRWIVGGIAGALGVALIATGPASAAPSTTTATFVRAASSYTSPSLGSTSIAGFKADDQVAAVCFVNADYVNGTNVWIRLANENGGGWVSRSAVKLPPLSPC